MRSATPLAAIALGSLLSAADAGTVGPDSIAGLWSTEPNDQGYAHVEVVREGATFSGRIVWLSQPNFTAADEPELAGRPKTDRNNPDPAQRGRPIVGLTILRGLAPAGDGAWKGGSIYDPQNGKTYRCNARLDPDGTLRLRGFIGISLLGRTARWVRAAAP